ncbi:MAG: deoxyuridine 5'-triphosphate nucleotidohydrolase [Bacillota bacterium]|nr:MAG: deoxyuridine 5'-triphosphate nucleotidohydrolase [Bacillota bacterium]
MKAVAKFEKVSPSIFERAAKDCGFSANYADIVLPRRATSGSAGYDFFAPADFTLNAGESVKIPTGVRAHIENGYFLSLYPRSGLGFKFRLQLDNTVGIIDADYYFSDNEGHIIVKLTNCSYENKTVAVKKGQGFAQGIFTEFFITSDDDADATRNGGFGSTTK